MAFEISRQKLRLNISQPFMTISKISPIVLWYHVTIRQNNGYKPDNITFVEIIKMYANALPTLLCHRTKNDRNMKRPPIRQEMQITGVGKIWYQFQNIVV